VEPVRLPPNQLHRFYKGGARIASFRSTGNDDPYAPEEWIASMASPFGEPGVGRSVLPDDTPLSEAIAAAPEEYLGAEHVERFGPDVAVLIKLLDAGERLPVHLHPDDAFAQAHLGSIYGKTEAWIILEAAPGAAVHVGFREPVTEDTVSDWVRRQDAASMLASLHRLPVSPGATIFVPAGTPHAIGEGILMAELQQPTDFSVLLEWEGFAIDEPAAGHLGLGFDLALRALDRSAWSDADVAQATGGRSDGGRPGAERLFPAEADPFFRAERIRPAPTPLEPAFSVLLVTDGRAEVRGDGWKMDVARGDALLVPHAAGECILEGDAGIVRCMPPAPDSKR
jgi:mannose-6-phosphate isomerase